jgi:hypothetical protein
VRAASAHLCLNSSKLIARGYKVEIFDRSLRGLNTVGRGLGVKIARSRRCTASARRSGPLESAHRRYLNNPMIHALSMVQGRHL